MIIKNTTLILKIKILDKYNLSRMSCIILNEMVSLKHNKYPFDFVYQNHDSSLMMNKVENSHDDIEKVKTVLKIVKGLSGKGVSFMVNKDNSDYYLVNHKSSEDILLQQKEESGQFNKDATFEIDNKYSDKSNLFSVQKNGG